ncbi:MAG TPA: hypothetical protein VGK34_10305 [Armatimonadota bacterium]
MSDSTTSFRQIASRLREEFPGVKLLALGQTIFWDEPMKAVLRRLLDEQYPEAVMAVGIHDADYFSRIPANLDLPEGWMLLPHNDGSTRDLWVATGEISTLFGSETVPSRDLLTSFGAQVDKIGRDYQGGREALIETVTEAWGWRGLVHRDSTTEVSCCVPLKDVLPSLLDLLRWGFDHTIDSLAEPVQAELARREAKVLLREVEKYAEGHPDASIAQAFLDILPRIYGRLLGYQPANLELTRITELFNFNRATAGEPRFKLLGAFLDPATRVICQEAYDASIEGSDINTLDRFCEGAIPFDLVIPGTGRGTICLLDDRISIDLDEPVEIRVEKMPTTLDEFASIIEDRFGDGISLVGKALTLVLMMTSEFIFVLNEQGSSYVPYCEKMAGIIRAHGLDFSFFPILRIGYQTWDSLSACDAVFSLPGHLANAFQQSEMTSSEFADSWRSAVGVQQKLLDCLASCTSSEELLTGLAREHGGHWSDRVSEYREAITRIRELSERTEPMKEESVRLRDLSYQMKQDVQSMEAEKGEHFRREIKARRDRLFELESSGNNGSPEAEQITAEIAEQEKIRAEMQSRIEKAREDAQAARIHSLELKDAVHALEKGDEARKSRDAVKQIEYQAELARLWLIRDALLVSKGLTFTDHRPSAWWFILVDPELKWFNKVVETAEFRWEEIDSAGSE